MSAIELVRRNKAGTTRGSTLETAFPSWKGRDERWLFVSPHDDDVAAGAGILLQQAVAEKIPITVAITTDGSMGYCSDEDRPQIVDIRGRETVESFSLYGIDDLRRLGYADNDLYRFAGRRPAVESDPGAIQGYTGLQNSYTKLIRDVRPTRLFVPTEKDFHPDHKIVCREALISVFHAGGAIWPELGPPLAEIPQVYEMAIYCEFGGEPNIRITGNASHLEKKLAALRSYRSQRQIENIIATIADAGPVEYFRDIDYHTYSPEVYSELFV